MAYQPSRKFVGFVAVIAIPLALFAYGAQRVKGKEDTEVPVIPDQVVPEATQVQDDMKAEEAQNVPLIIIDPGHGDTDVGTIGPQTGRYEKEVNLEISMKLKNALEQQGFHIMMTRQSDDPLGPAEEPDIGKRKEADMRKREEMIDGAGADLLISIHQNRFDDPSVKGPQVFYLKNKSDGKEYGVDFARAIQSSLNETLGAEHPRSINPGDWRLLKKGSQPGCIVECGFFSNPYEEALLQQSEYQDKLVSAIAAGIGRYTGDSGI